mgnify:CR=1 FL=1
MAKIIKHTFIIPKLSVIDGELVEGEGTSVTCQFTLLFKGIGLYEEISGKSLLNSLMSSIDYKDEDADIDVQRFTDSKLIKDLACASYIKIDKDKFHNNRATAEEFRKSQVYNLVDKDYDFIMKLLSMAMECVYRDEKAKEKSKKASRPKK